MVRLQKFSGELRLISFLPAAGKSLKRYHNNYIQLRLYADDQPIVDFNSYHLYLGGLIKSTAGTGDYQIICCGCGYAFCSSPDDYITTVAHHRDHIEWIGKRAAPKVHCFFDKSEYHQVIHQLKADADQYFTSKKERLMNHWIENEGGQISVYPNDMLRDWMNETSF